MPRKRQDTAQADLFASASPRPAHPNPSAVEPGDTGPVIDPVSFIAALADDDLRRVAEAAQVELRRRQRDVAGVVSKPDAGRAVVAERRQRVKFSAEAALTPGQASAVRAALAAGLTARQVAKQFGVPEKAVRQAGSK